LVVDIDRYCQKRGVDFVIPADESATRLLLKNRDALHSANLFPAPGFELFNRLNNKWQFSRLVHECGAPQPLTKLVTSSSDIRSLGCSYPLIVKPLEGSSSEGVFLVDSEAQLQRHFDVCDSSGALPFLVQELVSGADMDLTILANHGKIVAWTLQERHPGFSFRFVRNDALYELGRKVVEFTKYNGVIDFDLRYDAASRKAWLIEANPRLPGSLRFKLWAGVNLVDMGLQMAAGGHVSSTVPPPQGFCVDYGCSPKHLLRALCRGRLTPKEWPPFTANAWRMNLSDPLPNVLLWFAHKLGRHTATPLHTPQPMPR
jgi:biotin carboxylase